MDPITTTVTLIGGIGALIGLATKAKDIWDRSDRIFWHRYLKGVTQSYQDQQSRTRFAYSRVPGAIPLECTRLREPGALDLVTLLTNAATSTSSPKPLLVLGEYGQGKTVACGDLANRLAIYSQEHRKAQHIPILVRLQDNPDLHNLDGGCSHSIQTLYSIKVDESVVKRAAIQGRLVYILDGADECLSNADPDEAYTSLSKLAQQALFRKNALVVTSRPNLMTAAHFRRLQESFDIVNITFPRLSQIFEYLKRRGQIEMVSIAQKPGNEHFAELIKRPLFLDMAVATADLIPDTVPVNDATLFDHYFESWYLRELSKLGPQTRTFSRLQAEEILSEAAHAMFVSGTTFLSEEAFAQSVQRITGSNIRAELENLKNQARNRLMLVPIELQSRKVLSFKHDALKSYFLAVHFQLALMKQPPELALPEHLDSLSLGFFVTRVSSSPIVVPRFQTTQ